MPFFDLRVRWVESSDFGTKSDDLGHRILKSYFIPSDFAKSDCISRPILFSDRKIKIRRSESDRKIISLTKTGPNTFYFVFFLHEFSSVKIIWEIWTSLVTEYMRRKRRRVTPGVRRRDGHIEYVRKNSGSIFDNGMGVWTLVRKIV